MKNYYGSSSLFISYPFRRFGGRIALKGWANCNSPLRVCYPNVGKYHVNTRKYTKRRHRHGMDLFVCVVGAKSASWRSGVCDEIRPCCNLPILQNSSMLQIHPCCKFIHVAIRPHCISPILRIHPCG